MSNKLEQVVENIKQFLVRVSPKISFSPDSTSEYSLSLGITPKDYSPEEILNLPERIAQEKGIRLVVCIDEFQQIGEFPDTLTVQKNCVAPGSIIRMYHTVSLEARSI